MCVWDPVSGNSCTHHPLPPSPCVCVTCASLAPFSLILLSARDGVAKDNHEIREGEKEQEAATRTRRRIKQQAKCEKELGNEEESGRQESDGRAEATRHAETPAADSGSMIKRLPITNYQVNLSP